MANRFLQPSITDVTDGSGDIVAGTLTSINFDPNLPVKTDEAGVLVTGLLEVGDVNGLTQTLSDAVTLNPVSDQTILTSNALKLTKTVFTENQEVVTKKYVDDNIGGIGNGNMDTIAQGTFFKKLFTEEKNAYDDHLDNLNIHFPVNDGATSSNSIWSSQQTTDSVNASISAHNALNTQTGDPHGLNTKVDTAELVTNTINANGVDPMIINNNGLDININDVKINSGNIETINGDITSITGSVTAPTGTFTNLITDVITNDGSNTLQINGNQDVVSIQNGNMTVGLDGSITVPNASINSLGNISCNSLNVDNNLTIDTVQGKIKALADVNLCFDTTGNNSIICLQKDGNDIACVGDALNALEIVGTKDIYSGGEVAYESTITTQPDGQLPRNMTISTHVPSGGPSNVSGRIDLKVGNFKELECVPGPDKNSAGKVRIINELDCNGNLIVNPSGRAPLLIMSASDITNASILCKAYNNADCATDAIAGDLIIQNSGFESFRISAGGNPSHFNTSFNQTNIKSSTSNFGPSNELIVTNNNVTFKNGITVTGLNTGGAGTLQEAYDGGQSISTTSGPLTVSNPTATQLPILQLNNGSLGIGSARLYDIGSSFAYTYLASRGRSVFGLNMEGITPSGSNFKGVNGTEVSPRLEIYSTSPSTKYISLCVPTFDDYCFVGTKEGDMAISVYNTNSVRFGTFEITGVSPASMWFGSSLTNHFVNSDEIRLGKNGTEIKVEQGKVTFGTDNIVGLNNNNVYQKRCAAANNQFINPNEPPALFSASTLQYPNLIRASTDFTEAGGVYTCQRSGYYMVSYDIGLFKSPETVVSGSWDSYILVSGSIRRYCYLSVNHTQVAYGNTYAQYRNNITCCIPIISGQVLSLIGRHNFRSSAGLISFGFGSQSGDIDMELDFTITRLRD